MPPAKSNRVKTSIRAGLLGTAVALLMIAVLGGSAGVAATPACGASCTEFSSPVYGAAATPAFVLADAPRAATGGQPLTVARANNANAGEDFISSLQGTVNDFINAGLANPGLGPLYGTLFVSEIEYSPFGSGTGFCAGVPRTPANGTRVDLEPCGVSARTVWISDNGNSHNGSNVVLISLATTSNFSDPQVLTTLLPGQPLFTSALRTLASGASSPNQQWGTRNGPF